MHQSANIDAVIEHAEPATQHQLTGDLVSESNARSEIAERAVWLEIGRLPEFCRTPAGTGPYVAVL
jgi:hypothetical protein